MLMLLGLGIAAHVGKRMTGRGARRTSGGRTSGARISQGPEKGGLLLTIHTWGTRLLWLLLLINCGL